MGSKIVRLRPCAGPRDGQRSCCLVSGIVLSFRLAHKLRIHSLANTVAFLVLTLPYLLAFAEAPKQPPGAPRLWSDVLEKGTWQAMNTGSELSATRQLVFAGDRVLAVFDAGYPQYADKQPMSKYRLLSIEAETGEVKNSREFIGRWGAMPHLFLNERWPRDLGTRFFEALNPIDRGWSSTQLGQRTDRRGISPDGSTLARATEPGTILLDSHTLAPVGKPLVKSSPTSSQRDCCVDLRDLLEGVPQRQDIRGVHRRARLAASVPW